ncbi:Fc.00g014260.m01.CDS01 [Cosmosporella sp. VM-42]
MDLNSQLRTSILSASLPTPSSTFLTTLTTSRSPPPPLPSLLATARARILAADLTNTTLLDLSLPSFPAGVNNAETKELKLSRPVHVQVLDIENLSLSRWEQVEELEAIERGETTRGREVIRVTAEDDDNEAQTGPTQTQRSQRPTTEVRAAGKNATHRLVLQDCRGMKVYALELKRMDGVGVGKTNIGEKILLKAGTVVARGMLLLEPEKCVLLGGKVEAWQKIWLEGRLARLKDAVGGEEAR